MMPDHAVKIEEILLEYKDKPLTKEIKFEIYKKIAPLMGDLSEHLDRHATMDSENRRLNLILKAKTPLGKKLLEMLGDGASEMK